MIRLLASVALLLSVIAPIQGALLFHTNATWKYFKGNSDASTPDTTAWRRGDFNDSAWTTAPAPFWYDNTGDSSTLAGGTRLTDMFNGYTCIFMRRTFVLTNLADISGLKVGYLCDDGFVLWVNGAVLYPYNMPGTENPRTGSASGAVTEPALYTTVDRTNISMLVLGTNTVAVQAFNFGIGSSDFGINLSLATIAPDPTPPAVASKSPAPGTVNALSQITVVFSEPVAGINASDLRINGIPATNMSGGNDTFTFTFPQPAYGAVTISWASGHGITDFGIPPNPFNTNTAGSTWQYNLVDNTPPSIDYQIPYPGVTIRSLTQIDVQFTEGVLGVDAGDLLINGNPASTVAPVNTSRYVFQFPEPMPGTVQVQWAAGHNIRDFATSPNAFAGGNWSYILDPNAVVSAVRINELMAANVNGLRDEDNQPQDWVELHNLTSNTVSLLGWSLTDDDNDEDKWTFPSVVIPPRGYLLVFCSEKDRKPTTPGSRLHTNFKLDPEGEFLGLYNAEVPRELVSSFNPYPNQRQDYSYGYDRTDQLRYFQTPTPGTSNGISSITGVVADTKFSHDRGLYTNAFSLVITCATPGVTIRYTRDGTAPTATTGLIYSSPIQVIGTTVIRAAAYRTGLLPSDVDAHTYLFLNDVITQAANGQPPPGWPASWGANVVDYGMDPDVVNNPTYSATIKEDLKSIPSFSIVMYLNDMFSSTNGIYANPGGDQIQWERPCSLELIYPDDREGFQINCGIRIRGGFSRSTANPKHAFRFFFRQEYGASKLNYPVFGATGASSFDKFDLRTMQNYSWAFQGDGNMICLRDQMARDQQMAMSGNATRGGWYHLYINGMYWGLYNTEERPEAAFGESYYGGQAEDYDTIKIDPDNGYNIEATDGNTAAWLRLWQTATNGFINDADYFRVQGLNVDGTRNLAYEDLLDVDNLIDYMLITLYGGNLDAPISNFLGNNSPNNWYGIRNRDGLRGGFRFFQHDAEHTLLDVNADRTGPYPAGDPAQGSTFAKSNPQYIWQRLQANAEFRMRVADRAQKACFGNGALSVSGARSLYLARSNEIQRAIVGESARWGDAKVGTPYTRATWLNALQNVYNNFLGGRTTVLLNQLRNDNLFPNLNAPLFSSSGGVVSNGFSLFLTNNNGVGTLYYTLDGSDPRSRGGNVASSAVAYTAGTPIVINFPTVVRARVRNGTIWSAITEATFYTLQNFSGLIVTEIMYNSPAFGSFTSDNLEFLELKNAGTNTLDFSGIFFSEGINFSFTNRTRLAPGQFFVLGRNSAALNAKYPGVAVNGLFTGRLDNSGEQLILTHSIGTTVLSVDYKNSGRWPLTPDGYGFSLVTKTPNANENPSNPSSWRASTLPGGSPGADDPAPLIPPILINEVLTHSDPPVVDAIELHNPTANEVNIGGWFLTDDSTLPRKFRIPDGTLLPAGEYMVFTEAQFNVTPGTNNSFSLSSQGEEVYLFSGNANTNLTGYSHGFTFGAAPTGVCFGRHVISTGDERFPLQMAESLGTANSGPLVGPLVLRQIMYHPPDLPGGLDNVDEEYIEIRNISGSTVPLFDPMVPTNTWRLRGGSDFNFPTNVTLGPGQSLIVLSFDPANSVKLSAFLGKYGVFAGLPVFGPYSSKLDNSSDEIELQRPDHPETNAVPYIIVDSVDYKDVAPWTPSADGGGASLQRRDLHAYGDDPANWIGAAPLTITAITPSIIGVRAGTNEATATNVTFTVDAYGTGNLSYQWQKNGIPLPGATNNWITITNVQMPDEGAYTAVVTDISGSSVSPPANLFILINPVIVQPPLSQTVVAGGLVTLSITVTGNPAPFTYEWRRLTAPLSTNTYVLNSRTSFLSFTAPDFATTLSYRCVVKNMALNNPGVSHTSVTITVLPDSDDDGIPDSWESGYGFVSTNALDAADDPDHDGLTNEEEYIAGTNPTNELSYFAIKSLAAGPPATLEFQALSNRTYRVSYKNDVGGNWLTLTDIVATATDHMETVIDLNPGTNRIYRLSTPVKP